MADHHDLGPARQAHAQQDWPTAAAAFAAVPTVAMTAGDLATYADTQFWLGHVEECLDLTTAAYDGFVEESRPEGAAMAAIQLGIMHMSRGDEPQAMGWIGRAGRLTQDIDECAAHGYLMFVTDVEASLQLGQPAEAVAAARRLQDLGDRLADPNLSAMGIHAEGRAMLKAGDAADGLALIDEAMVSVLDGRLSPFNQWTLYCFTIAACHEVADLGRMGHWTDLAEAWLTSRPAAGALGAGFGAMCGVHRAQLHLLHGDWEEAERTALPAAQLATVRFDYGAEAWYVVAEARRLRGASGATAAYDEAHARGRNPQPGRALLLLARGDAETAARTLRSALAAVGEDRLRRAPLCAAVVEASVAAGRLDDAAGAASELQETAARWETSGLRAMAASAQGAVLLAQGQAEAALPVLSDACARWLEVGARYDAARACHRLAEAYRTLGDETSAAAETALAQVAFADLGVPLPRPEAPDGLTARECEVLALVAEGRSNAQIGDALFISDRTVARHLTNVFHKIDVTSRTQAARYAMEHHLNAG